VAAALLAREGREVVGVTMRTMPEAGHNCESAPDAAARVAAQLGIPHHVVDLMAEFRDEVIDPWVAEYAAGRTPNPCMMCNRRFKFGALYRYALRLGVDAMATGHYARIAPYRGAPALRRAVDPAKDQSYFLSGLTRDQLARAVFPLGGRPKTETRKIADELGLGAAVTPESQEICFVPGGDYRPYLHAQLGEPGPGPIVNLAGEVLGTHSGLVNYTVGQRKGLGVAAPRPLYVLRLDPARNALVVGYEEDTYASGLTAVGANWSAIDPEGPFETTAQIRLHQDPVPCTVEPSTADTFAVQFDEPVRSVAPGQWVVLYDGEFVLGNGVIDAFEPVDDAASGSVRRAGQLTAESRAESR
jgi:tRNA-specific 2-thiouridylase